MKVSLCWRPADTGENSARCERIVDELRRAGLHVGQRGVDPSHATGPGIVLFQQIRPELLEAIRAGSRGGRERVLAIAADGGGQDSRELWACLEAGAADVLIWNATPCPADAVRERFLRWAAVDGLVRSPAVTARLVGESPAWIAALRRVVEVGAFTDAAVLIEGETGTGKELIARLLHDLDSRRKKGSFVVVDCTTIVPELAGSEFFGHERGAFTGAVCNRAGAFAEADGGTLFLDEVGELPLPLQAQLLRVIQEGTYKRVGGNSWHDTSFRLVCATNRRLRQAVETGTFRRDLYYRIANVPCWLPPLAERVGDIVPLALHFMRQTRKEQAWLAAVDDGVRSLLASRAYPGNVRELKQLVSRIMVRHVGNGPVTVGDVPEDERPPAGMPAGDRDVADLERTVRRILDAGQGLRQISQIVTDAAIRIAIDDSGNGLRLAAQRLGVTERALQMRRARWRDSGPSRPRPARG